MPTQKIILPVWERSPVLIRAVQGEAESRTVSAALADGDGQPVDLTGASARMYVQKPDRTSVFLDGTVSDAACGICGFTLPSGVTAAPGIADCQLLISWADGRSLKVPGLILEILPSDWEETVESGNDFSALVTALNQTDAAISSAAQSAENARQALAGAQTAVADSGAALSAANSAAAEANTAAVCANAAAAQAGQAALDTGRLYQTTDPLTGQTAPVTAIIDGLTAYLFRDAVSAQAMDSLGMNAQDLDALEISAVDFDTGAKTKLEVS